jgi:MOSC domain-containing protein YiiM
MPAKLLSVNIARPHEFLWRGHAIQTGIYKEPVPGPIAAKRLGLAGDVQVDKRVHGGPLKAVYLYPAEHYEFWRGVLSIVDLPPGSLGENFTTEGILESSTHAGDQFRIGAAIFEVTQPREPCFKLALKFARPDIIQIFRESNRSGIYFFVAQEGEVEAGQAIERVKHQPNSPTIEQIAAAKNRQ